MELRINLTEIKEPKTKNHLVIEGAGGLLVPLNDSETILDLIKPNYKVIVVSRHYLGSINHTLINCKIIPRKRALMFPLFFLEKNIKQQKKSFKK